MQADPRVLALSWLQAAERDAIVADEYARRFPNIACFHAQQVAEKALKAVLVLLAGDVARTHVANELLAELTSVGASVPAAVAEAARSLDKYYAPTRYPDALAGASPLTAFTAADGTSAAATARTVLDWAQSRLNS